eukprot:TRINITY_DN22885_c0_g1_i5.p1 TRINITY_DN22885_c0_g1~~TRINITY_DN22885_c0_g1_i5.p1  ORF type:complete len:649 (+),score=96.69 TRINITY_DN22885_c0_g1_i5:260-2206(+)
MQQRIEHEVQELFRLFRWKKYGNKEIKGGPICRRYYFCRTCGLKLKIDYVKQISSFGEELNIIKKWELDDPKCHMSDCCHHAAHNNNTTLDSSDCSGVNNFQLLVDAAVDAYQGLDDGTRQHSDFETDQLDLHSMEKSSCQTHSTIPEVEPRCEPANTQLAARQAAEALIKGPLSPSSPSVQKSLNRKRKKTHHPSLLFEFYEDSEFEDEEYGNGDNQGDVNQQMPDVEDDEYEDEYEDDQVTYCDGQLCDLDSDEYQPPNIHHRSSTINNTSSQQNRLQKSSQDRLIVQQCNSNDRRTVLVLKENLKHYEGLEEYGYRKYGQKDIQGSLYPRSYHRCNRESCPARKQVQQIDNSTYQINYLYQHDHQPLDQSARHRRNRRSAKCAKTSRRKTSKQTPKRKPKQQQSQDCEQCPQPYPQVQNKKSQLYSYRVLPLHLQDKLIHSAMQIASSQAYLNSQQGIVVSSMLGHVEQQQQQQHVNNGSSSSDIHNNMNNIVNSSPNSTLHLALGGILGGESEELQEVRGEMETSKTGSPSLFQLLQETKDSCKKSLSPLLQMPWGSEGQTHHYDLNAALTVDELGGGRFCRKFTSQTSAENVLFLQHPQEKSEEDQQQYNNSLNLLVAGQDMLRKSSEREWEEEHNIESGLQE